jgi:uncharacterized protein
MSSFEIVLYDASTVKPNRTIFAAFLLIAAGHAGAASFDCSRAATKTEKTICLSQKLSALDEQLGKEYAKAAKLACKSSDLRKGQRMWLALRDQSPTDWDMARRYEERISELQGDSPVPVFAYSYIF